ncbi:S8/S53 family peptidase [Microbacter sp. GSS18]|nr:S8/S53 family peptidase [Microbacter sp. GSS18]
MTINDDVNQEPPPPDDGGQNPPPPGGGGGGRARRIARVDAADELVGPGDEVIPVQPTFYVLDELVIDTEKAPGALEYLQTRAREAGWSADAEPNLSSIEVYGEPEEPLPAIRVKLKIPPGAWPPPPAPDAWQLLRQAFAEGRATGIGLNHVGTFDSYGVGPYTANPYTANPYTANPYTANPYTANPYTANVPTGIGSYAVLGFGARQPVTYVGPKPKDAGPDGPVVAVFDTGLGTHDWIDSSVESTVQPLGFPLDAGPEKDARVSEPPLQGNIDAASGHGTFIAGLIRQGCPDARILPVRIAAGDGVIEEADLLQALKNLRTYMEAGGRVDVLNLSFSFYPETGSAFPGAPVEAVLSHIRNKLDCAVVCSAGNGASDKPTFPASLGYTVAVGALNPPGDSIALFSNIGDWVDVYAPGVSLVSTLPPDFEGSVQAGMCDETETDIATGKKLRRTTLDIDDFGGDNAPGGGGFAVWSGTSFAAAVISAAVACEQSAGTAATTGGLVANALAPYEDNTSFLV